MRAVRLSERVRLFYSKGATKLLEEDQLVLVVQQNAVHPAIPSSSRAPYSLAAPSFTAPSQALAPVTGNLPCPILRLLAHQFLAFALIAA